MAGAGDGDWIHREVQKGDGIDPAVARQLIEDRSPEVDSVLLAIFADRATKFDVAALAGRILVERDRDPTFLLEYWGSGDWDERMSKRSRMLRSLSIYPAIGATDSAFAAESAAAYCSLWPTTRRESTSGGARLARRTGAENGRFCITVGLEMHRGGGSCGPRSKATGQCDQPSCGPRSRATGQCGQRQNSLCGPVSRALGKCKSTGLRHKGDGECAAWGFGGAIAGGSGGPAGVGLGFLGGCIASFLSRLFHR